MGRKRIEISQEVLTGTIRDAESEQSFPSRSALFAFIAEVLDVEPHTVANRVREWNVDLKTPLGKRGRPAGVKTVKAVVSEDSSVDFSELFAAFSGVGIQVKSTADIMTSAHKTTEQNQAIKTAWHNLREMVDSPAPGRVFN